MTVFTFLKAWNLVSCGYELAYKARNKNLEFDPELLPILRRLEELQEERAALHEKMKARAVSEGRTPPAEDAEE